MAETPLVSITMNKVEYFGKVIRIVSDVLDVEESEIIGCSRIIEAVDARWIAIKLMHDKGYSSRQIAPLFNKTKRAIDHTLQYFRNRSEDPFSTMGNNYAIARQYLRNSEETSL